MLIFETKILRLKKLIAKHFETKQFSSTKLKPQLLHSMVSISFFLHFWLKPCLEFSLNSQILLISLKVPFVCKWLLKQNIRSNYKVHTLTDCISHKAINSCSGNHNGFQLFLYSYLLFNCSSQEPANSWKTKWHHLSAIYTSFSFHSSSMYSFHASEHLWFTQCLLAISCLVFSISFLGSSHLYFLCYAMPGYTNANRIWTYESNKRVPCHPFCEMRIFLRPHYDQGLVGFAPELCKMIRQLSFND